MHAHAGAYVAGLALRDARIGRLADPAEASEVGRASALATRRDAHATGAGHSTVEAVIASHGDEASAPRLAGLRRRDARRRVHLDGHGTHAAATGLVAGSAVLGDAIRGGRDDARVGVDRREAGVAAAGDPPRRRQTGIHKTPRHSPIQGDK